MQNGINTADKHKFCSIHLIQKPIVYNCTYPLSATLVMTDIYKTILVNWQINDQCTELLKRCQYAITRNIQCKHVPSTASLSSRVVLTAANDIQQSTSTVLCYQDSHCGIHPWAQGSDTRVNIQQKLREFLGKPSKKTAKACPNLNTISVSRATKN